MMKTISYEYLKSLVPENLPKGKDVVEEGIALGKTIKAGRSKFIRDSKYDNYLEYTKDCMKNGKLKYMAILGLPTLDEQVKGLNELYEFGKRNNFDGLTQMICIESTLQAIPKELRGDTAGSNAFLYETFEDWCIQCDNPGIEPYYVDHILGCPMTVENTINAVKAGVSTIGTISQFLWRHPGCEDYTSYLVDTIKSIGIIASKFDEGVMALSYNDDGIPAYFSDAVSYVAYSLLEHHIFRKLCGARYAISFGGLLSDIRYRGGVLLALQDLLQTEEEPTFGFFQASTTMQWDHDVNSNFGTTMQEMLCEILLERKYRTGATICAIPVTEKLHAPTLEVIKDIIGATIRLEEKAEEWEDIIDFTAIENIAKTMKVEGKKMFENILNDLSKAGIDTNDPVQLIHFLFNMNPGKFEEAFHPTVRENGKLVPYFPTDMGQLTDEMIEVELKKLNEENLEGCLQGKKMILASTDSHVYGLTLAKRVYKEMGATVADGGVDATPASILDMADEEGANIIGISTHNGGAHEIAKQLVELAAKRGKYHIVMGGVLNAVFPGHTELVDVTDIINDMGVCAGNDLCRSVKYVRDCE